MSAAMPLFDAEQPSADLILGDCREVMAGTTLLAARAEGFRSIGIDMDEHAREIAQKRLT